jgi:hypothetical protein
MVIYPYNPQIPNFMGVYTGPFTAIFGPIYQPVYFGG